MKKIKKKGGGEEPPSLQATSLRKAEQQKEAIKDCNSFGLQKLCL